MPQRKNIKRPRRNIRLFSKRLELRPYQISDFKVLHESHTNRTESVDRFDEPIPVAQESYEKYKKRLKRNRSNEKGATKFIFAIFARKTGAYVGQIDLYTFNKELRWGNLGYHIQNQYYGQGYATEAGILCLRAAFKLLGYHRIEASMEPANKKSQKLAIRLGLKFEGKRSEFFPEKRGVHLIVYATNAVDWSHVRPQRPD